jgi:anthranilate phosphoribosyltransferase
MSKEFREFVKKIGSGPHTGEDLTREEPAAATRMMLEQVATPAQIGAFLIAHRIKRPTGEELAGMLDAYDALGPKLQTSHCHSMLPLVFGIPYDGRSRTAPIIPLTVLILMAANVPVVLHGGDRVPTKYGIPLTEIWQGLGVGLTNLSLPLAQSIFETTGLGFIYLPNHFPLANSLMVYRDQIGKRPPLSTLELIWCPCDGEVRQISGYVHPPTENMFKGAIALRQTPGYFTTVKGLEGSCDLPRDRTAIIGATKPDGSFERIFLSHSDYGFSNVNPALESTEELIAQIQTALRGEASEMTQSALWNGGFYLWHSGVCPDMNSGIAEAKNLLTGGHAAKKLQEIREAVGSMQAVLMANS